MRTPFAVAKTVGTAAVLSGNRVALGIGMGWNADEFALMEQPFRQRGKRADEMLEVLAKLWAGGWVEHHGEFYDFDRVEMSPAPTERVPVYVGGMSEAALRRAARHDGWISDLHRSDELVGICATLQPLPRGAGPGRRAVRRRRVVKDAADPRRLPAPRRRRRDPPAHVAVGLLRRLHRATCSEGLDGVARASPTTSSRSSWSPCKVATSHGRLTQGTCDDSVRPAVRDAFAANFDQGLDVGASVAVALDGELVVDLWGGTVDDAGTPWERDTITNVWSTTKTMTALCALHARRPRRARRRRAGGDVLARVRGRGQGRRARAPPHVPHRRPPRAGPSR